MSRNNKNQPAYVFEKFLEVKSKLDAEFRRFLLNSEKTTKFDDFIELLKTLHHLGGQSFTVWYTDYEGDLLPINNNDNYACAIRTFLKSRRPFKLSLIKNGEISTLLKLKSGTLNSSITSGLNTFKKVNIPSHPIISFPEDFRRVSAIIDIDVVPETCRRVKLMKSVGTDRPLGFYIRDGVSIRVTIDGMEKVPGVFISRLVTGGLAESTGLLAVNDEILEVNGIEVAGKTLDQVTDMMVANSNNLIITVKPVNQHNNITPRKSAKHVRSDSMNSTLLSNLEKVDEEGLEDEGRSDDNNRLKMLHNGSNVENGVRNADHNLSSVNNKVQLLEL